MSRITMSLASFSWARSAIRCAWSSAVRWSNAPRSLEVRVSPVKTGTPDFPSDLIRNQAIDRLTGADATPDVARRHIDSRDVEELDPLGLLELGEHAFQGLRRIARARRHREPCPAQDFVRVLPGGKGREFVRADEEDRVREVMLAQGVGGARVGLGMKLRPREAVEGEAGELVASLEVDLGALVAGVDDD